MAEGPTDQPAANGQPEPGDSTSEKLTISHRIDLVDLGFKLITVIVGLLAASWAYQEFTIKYHLGTPLELQVAAEPIDLDDGKSGISVTVSMMNKGNETILALKPYDKDNPGDDRYMRTGLELTVAKYTPSQESQPVIKYWNGDSSEDTMEVVCDRFQMLRGYTSFMKEEYEYSVVPNTLCTERAVIKVEPNRLYAVYARFWGQGHYTNCDVAYIFVPDRTLQK